MDSFKATSGFCPDCGTVLPLLRASGGVTCYNCDREFSAEAFSNSKISYEIIFNSREAYEKNQKDFKKSKGKRNEDEEEGPIVDRKCPKCGNEKMSYATLQLRSADEGQTVFYTCTKCKYKETENS